MSTSPRPTRAPRRIDPRAYRFSAAITSAVLVIGLVLGLPWGLAPLAGQTLVFAIGAVLGLEAQPYLRLFSKRVRPRLDPAESMVDPRPAQFDQALGLGLMATALLAGLLSLPVLFYLPVVVALVDSALTAATGRCPGAHAYAHVQRLRRRVNDELSSSSVQI